MIITLVAKLLQQVSRQNRLYMLQQNNLPIFIILTLSILGCKDNNDFIFVVYFKLFHPVREKKLHLSPVKKKLLKVFSFYIYHFCSVSDLSIMAQNRIW